MATKRFIRLCAQSGLPALTPHGLRHTHATVLLRALVHPRVVQERLGHSSIQVTLDVYSHAVPALQGDAAARFAEIVDQVEESETRGVVNNWQQMSARPVTSHPGQRAKPALTSSFIESGCRDLNPGSLVPQIKP